MSETTGRCSIESTLNPSNLSVNKQIMLDWLRINHPMTPIKSGAKKAEVAKIVRDVQPHRERMSKRPASHNLEVPKLDKRVLSLGYISSKQIKVEFEVEASQLGEGSKMRMEQKLSDLPFYLMS
ncbi:uncharacterized protein MELLADRAFT_63663 [Melampsora larici-populina 98AG31]|uniref:Uncharacterized protein n=1 Tax=Melampsora larici-populina (strain 98AG31 / pathotype 3-4-7) TaxID=747676 RepID=F4RNI4_MELLP|nr:uncharacterized protein MELLADRAFT_63663 [Melampsora larici-populina 98AG31]EGG06090.1 hypothetical protein MELLADRAFT_63663 [Melampsora larici-populina 98AG31]